MIPRIFGGLTVAVLGATLLQFPAFAVERCIGLVIGNGAYKTTPLLTPVNDARLMAKTLRSLGFDVTMRTDVDQKNMKRLIRNFGTRLAQSKGVGLFYYSGHGLEVQGHNYMIPVGAVIERESDVDMEAVKVGHALATMEYARNNVNIVILDACRNNPYAKTFKSATKGLARMRAPAGTIIAYATEPGEVAIAGEGKYSPYTAALAKELVRPGLPVEMMFKEVAKKVYKSTRGRQLPWRSTSLLEAFYFVPTRQPARTTPAPPSLGEVLTNSIGMTFVRIPPGTFKMGSGISSEETIQKYGGREEWYKDEHPQHKVKISKSFYLQTTEVTQGQWKTVMGKNPSGFKGCGEDCPVEKVSWNDAQNFIKKLNDMENTKKYRLPTEAEWEYACRAGGTTAFSFGDETRRLGEYGWYNDNSETRAHPVGQKKPNAWGLYDMHGNVQEWCQDWFGGYPSGEVSDPEGPSTGEMRVKRGGTYFNYARDLRSSVRFKYPQDQFDSSLGFRVARDS